MSSITDNPSLNSPNAAAADELLDRAVQGAHSLIDQAAEKAGPAVERLRSGAESVSETIQSGAEELGDLQERVIESCRACVREHPLASIGVAVAAGIILSRIMQR